MRAFSVVHIDGVDMAADITPSAPIATDMLAALCVHLSWTATDTPEGNIIAQVSCDPPDLVKGPTNWVALDTSSYQAAAGGGAGSACWQIPDVAFNFFRVFYDVTSGGDGAALTVRVSGKGW